MKVLWQVESDPQCRAVLRKHWPDVPCYEDVRDVGSANLAPVDLICGGFPCQDISSAGKGAGISIGTRSGLWFEFARIIREIRPRYVLVENVPGLVTGGGIGIVLGGLATIGYDAEWSSVRASDFGAPHERSRVFIVAHTLRIGREGFFPARDPCAFGSWGKSRQEDLQSIIDRPFLPGPGYPQPLLRRMDDGVPNRVDRLRMMGNAVVPDIVEWVGRRIMETQP